MKNLDPITNDTYGACMASPYQESEETRAARERLNKQQRVISLAERLYTGHRTAYHTPQGAYKDAVEFLEAGKEFFESWPPES